MHDLSKGLAAALAALVLVPAQPIAAQTHASMPGLVVRMGEAWVFRVEKGQPVDARRVRPDEQPAKGELKVVVTSQAGMVMAVTNNDSTWWNYRASLTSGPDVRGVATSVCTLMSGGKFSFETWPQAAPAIRVADFERAEDGKMVCR